MITFAPTLRDHHGSAVNVGDILRRISDATSFIEVQEIKYESRIIHGKRIRQGYYTTQALTSNASISYDTIGKLYSKQTKEHLPSWVLYALEEKKASYQGD